MKLTIKVPVTISADPNSSEAINAANNAASQQASAWTTPTYQATENDQHIYLTDAAPRVTAVTTANIAPTLLTPRRR